ncbi:MAG: hypothetical protein AB7S81_05040 [Bdellovibrionales bacterium]
MNETKKKKPLKTTLPKKDKKTNKTEAWPFAEVEARIRQVLLELMAGSESDSVRVAAAKALMDKMKKGDEAEDDKRQQEEEHAAIVLEAQKLLEEIVCAKIGGTDCAGQMD